MAESTGGPVRPESADIWRNVKYGLAALVIVQLLGSVAYVFLGLGPLDAFYQTLITISTVGFGEVGDEIGPRYRIVTSLLIMGGVGVALYTLAAAFQAVVEGRLYEQIGRNRMQKVLDKMNNHVIVCGWGQVGRAIGRALVAQGESVVVIDLRADLLDVTDLPALVGDATEDGVLRQAGIERARCLVIALDSDSHCTYVTLTGRSLNPDLFIVARANGPTAKPKLRQAGANKVVNPHQIGGTRMAAFITQPNVADFLGEAMHDRRYEVELREVAVRPGSGLDGATLAESQLVESTGVTVLAIRRPDGSFTHRPEPSVELRAGDVSDCFGDCGPTSGAIQIRIRRVAPAKLGDKPRLGLTGDSSPHGRPRNRRTLCSRWRSPRTPLGWQGDIRQWSPPGRVRICRNRQRKTRLGASKRGCTSFHLATESFATLCSTATWMWRLRLATFGGRRSTRGQDGNRC